MRFAQIVICDRSGLWAATLRRLLAARRPVICETHSLAECREALSQEPRSLVLLDTSADSTELRRSVELLQESELRWPRATWIVALRGDAGACEMVREAGACTAITSLSQATVVADLVAKHVQPRDEGKSLRKELWSRLPWSDPPQDNADAIPRDSTHA